MSLLYIFYTHLIFQHENVTWLLPYVMSMKSSLYAKIPISIENPSYRTLVKMYTKIVCGPKKFNIKA